MTLRAKQGGPTPQPVYDAMRLVADYMRHAGYLQVIIQSNPDGGFGAAFRLDSIYDQMRDMVTALEDGDPPPPAEKRTR